MTWIVIGIALMLVPSVLIGFALVSVLILLDHRHRATIKRIFLEKPLFIVPRGQPEPDAEDIAFPTADGLTLRGCYLPRRVADRRGVILFGLEFGSNRWAAAQYVDYLREAGYDVFTWEPRNSGESDAQPGFEPLQWVTNREVDDCAAALAYVRNRPDADPRGVGLYGFSKGANAGLLVAARDPAIRCAVTDGAFGHYSVMVPYMRVWLSIYNKNRPLHGLVGGWFYGRIARLAERELERERGVEFPDVETAVRHLGRRPLLMIHGGADTYIKPSMARSLFEFARKPKEFWLVEGAKHNQALAVAGEEYRRRVLDFFDTHLAGRPRQATVGSSA